MTSTDNISFILGKIEAKLEGLEVAIERIKNNEDRIKALEDAALIKKQDKKRFEWFFEHGQNILSVVLIVFLVWDHTQLHVTLRQLLT